MGVVSFTITSLTEPASWVRSSDPSGGQVLGKSVAKRENVPRNCEIHWNMGYGWEIYSNYVYVYMYIYRSIYIYISKYSNLIVDFIGI